MRVLLVACYELGHQPLQVAVPAAHLRARGHDVRAVDLSLEPWDPAAAAWADRIAFSVPMHTATRLARAAIEALRATRPAVPVCCYGLYASMAADVADCVVAGETTGALVEWVEGRVPAGAALTELGREAARAGAPLPARELLPPIDRYAHLLVGDGCGCEQRLPVGYVEASHGCAHRCRHCPVPVVYDGRIRIVDADAVLADIAQQVDAGARHITFGDPDFLNGVHHSLRVVRAMHERFPDVSFDCTVKVEHVLAHAEVWPELAEAGCRFVVSAFESVNDEILDRLDKGHTAADAARAVAVLRTAGIEVRPSFMPFTPWTTGDDVRALLRFVAEHDLVENVDPVQYTIRLLIPRGSLVLRLPEVAALVGPYDAVRGTYEWAAPDPALDALHARLAELVEEHVALGTPIPEVYASVCAAAGAPVPDPLPVMQGRPRLSEPWFCCAEPTAQQITLTTNAAR
ncbi:MAG TPA: CUAEP/CCAEP-tail radical SAM protein [Acidimicrobiia bacterium]|nr:CUAEP/CCAEP-tail radical SAM protein [Acidimicrobiia bacterium]